MGPPSDEGGNVEGPLDRRCDLRASMGPPSDEGGNAHVASTASEARLCFNGAALR